MARNDINISAYLLTGKGNARTGRELARLLGCTPRDISLLVERERRAGTPILASCSSETPGYYLAETAGEIKNYCRNLSNRAEEIDKTRSALLETAEKMAREAAQKQAAAAEAEREKRPMKPIQQRWF